MLRRIAIATIAAISFAIAMGSGGCSHRDPLNLARPPEGGAPAFTEVDAPASDEPDAALVDYCPATSCPSSRTTCPGSRFQCDVNLMTDPNNCGACGIRCPGTVFGINADFACVAGKCVMTCSDHRSFDGNGVLDDGCEAPLGTNENCNDPGDQCLDPAKPCIFLGSQNWRCGCIEPGHLLCGTLNISSCIDPKTDDANCGGCSIACDRDGDGGTPPTNMYWGCVDAQCGRLKCTAGHGDCDGDEENGCESDLLSPSSCGACGNVCAPGQQCVRNPDTQVVACACPPGQALCGDRCVNLGSDPDNCGGCGVNCTFDNKDRGYGFCKFGACEHSCMEGWGDCNANPGDGCDTNFDSDPRNCGGCGIACAVGQPCVAGRCAVEPCEPGGSTK